MKKVTLLLAIILIAFACKKREDSTPKFGSLTGSFSPIGVINTVYATNALGDRLTAEVSGESGKFSFENIPVGNYILSTPEVARFKPMVALNAQVLADSHTDLGMMVLQPDDPQSWGAVVGTMLPVGFGDKVTATNVKNGETISIGPLSSTGEFMLSLRNGEYRLSFTAVKPAEAPADVTVKIAGDLVQLGSVIFGKGSSGSVFAKVSPISGVASVSAKNVMTGAVISGLVNRTLGTIAFPVMAAGDYQLLITTNTPYLKPAAIETKIQERTETELPEVSLSQDTEITMLSYNIGGTKTVRYNISGSFANGFLKFDHTLTTFREIIGRQNTYTNTLKVAIDNITGPGTYTFSGSANSTMSYLQTRRSGLSFTTLGN